MTRRSFIAALLMVPMAPVHAVEVTPLWYTDQQIALVTID